MTKEDSPEEENGIMGGSRCFNCDQSTSSKFKPENLGAASLFKLPKSQDYETITYEAPEVGVGNLLPEFEDVMGMEREIREMPSDRRKQFLFLHNIVNSSSDDSQFQNSDDQTDKSLSPAPIAQDTSLYHFRLTETPMPLPEREENDSDEEENLVRSILMMPHLVEYSIPHALKHLLCTDDNLMGLSDSITLERIVRKKSLGDIIPMSSRGTRKFLPLEVDFSPTHECTKNLINISTFIQKLSDKFQPRIGSFFNTKFQFSYRFNNGKFEITYGIFEDHDYFTQEMRDIDYIDLHVFSRYLPKDCFVEAKPYCTNQPSNECCEREWRSFITMTDIYAVVDHMLKGKCSFIQNSSHLLKYIKRGGSLKVAAKHYEISVQKNQQRILSNIKRYIKNKKVMSMQRAKELGKENSLNSEFHLGLFDQILGYYDDLGSNTSLPNEATYVVELTDFEEVIRSISAKYVYEKYVHPVCSEHPTLN